MFPDPLADFVEPVGHYETHCGEIVGGAETAGGDVALGDGLAMFMGLKRGSGRGLNIPCIGWARSHRMVAGLVP